MGTGAQPRPGSDCCYLLQNVNDLNQWLSALRKASAPNQDKLAACHPGAFRSGRWTCCLQAERSGEGAGHATGSTLPTCQSASAHFHLGVLASDLISLCLGVLGWEAGLRIALTSWVLLADVEFIYSKNRVSYTQDGFPHSYYVPGAPSSHIV